MSKVGVQAYIAGHGMYIADLNSVLRTERILREAWQADEGEQPYPYPVRATLEAWMITCGYATQRGEDGPYGYLYDHETEEECLVLLSSFHPLNNEHHNLADIESWERSLEALCLEAIQDDEHLNRQHSLANLG